VALSTNYATCTVSKTLHFCITYRQYHICPIEAGGKTSSIHQYPVNPYIFARLIFLHLHGNKKGQKCYQIWQKFCILFSFYNDKVINTIRMGRSDLQERVVPLSRKMAAIFLENEFYLHLNAPKLLQTP
jgi:hypothetical protein